MSESSGLPSAPILVKRGNIDPGTNPDLGSYSTVLIREGPRSRKTAVCFEIRDRNTGDLHHYAVKVQTLRKTKAGAVFDEKHSVTIGDDEEDEIARLQAFLATVRGLPTGGNGRYLIVEVRGGTLQEDSIRQILNAVSEHGTAEMLAELLSQLGDDAESLQSIVQTAKAEPGKSRVVAAALNVGRFSAALSQLQKLIESNAKESAFQSLLKDNPWMFGSEYSQILDRRRWTRDDQQDFMLRRTTDGYLEVIEIKTPLNGTRLFRPDASHHTLYPGPELSAVIGQVMDYIEQLDRDRDRILVHDQEDVSKVRGKIIIGRDVDSTQVAALRRLNGHLHRVEVLTFDQLVRITEQVVRYLTTNQTVESS